MTSRHPPVENWATDFDHTDPAWVADPYPIWEDLRQRCPVAHSDRYGGTWLPVTHELVSEVAYDTEHFTSRSVVVGEERPGPDDLPAPIGLSPPITSDPPFHAMARGMLLPAFGPRAIAALEPFTRDLCRELLAETEGRASFDAAIEYARHIPVRVIVRFLGFPQEDADSFRRFIRLVLEDVDMPAEDEEREAMFGELDAYMDAQIDDHIAHPRDDLTSFLIEAEIAGSKLSREHIRGTMILLMIAGIDTTWSAIGAALWHLARHPADRRRLAGDPGRLWSDDELAAIKREINAAGLELEAIENFDPAHWHDVLLDGPKKREQLENLKTIIRNVGRAGSGGSVSASGSPTSSRRSAWPALSGSGATRAGGA